MAETDPNEGFQLHRTGPIDEGSSPVVPILLALLLIGAAVGGFVLTRGDGEGGDREGGAGAEPTETVVAEVPDYILERLDFLEQQERYGDALDEAEARLDEYPGSPELELRIDAYRAALGISSEDLAELEDMLKESRSLIAAGKYAEALDLLDAIIEGGDDAEAYFLRGRCLGLMGRNAAAIDDLDYAAELGWDPDQVDRLIRQYE